MKLKNLFIGLCAMSLLLPPLAEAQAKPRTLTLTIGNGYIFFAPRRDLQNTWLPLSGALTYNFSEIWAIELAADIINANSGEPAQHHVHGLLTMLDALFRFHPLPYFEPYLLAGLGVMGIKPAGTESIQQGGMNAGLGVQLFQSDHVAFNAEARDIYTFVGGKNDVLLNLGISFLWD